jgi:hypothetical protein
VTSNDVESEDAGELHGESIIEGTNAPLRGTLVDAEVSP